MEPKLEWGNTRGRETLFSLQSKQTRLFFLQEQTWEINGTVSYFTFLNRLIQSPPVPHWAKMSGAKVLATAIVMVRGTLKNFLIFFKKESLIRREVIGSVKLFFFSGFSALLLLRGQDEGQDQVRGTPGGFAKQQQEGGRSGGGGEGEKSETWDKLSFWQTIWKNN